MYKANNRRSRKYALELKVVAELRKRLEAEDGSADIIMKADGKRWNVMECIDGAYIVSHTTYTRYLEVESCTRKVFHSLDEIAEWVVAYK